MRFPGFGWLVILAFWPLSPLFAGSTVVGSGTPASCTEAALNSAITVANGTFGIVTFNCGAAPHTLVVTSEKALATGVIVDGGGKITLSGGNNTRIFNLFQGAAVELRDITLTRGQAGGGGCLLAIGSAEKPTTLALNRVTFNICQSSSFGGAIAGTRANITVTDSLFFANVANLDGGGAISLNTGSLTSLRTTYRFNGALSQGGALQIWFSSSSFENDHILSNGVSPAAGSTASQGGGAVLLRGSIANVRQSRIHDNSANNLNGGAFRLLDGSDLLLEDTFLHSNATEATGLGGAVHIDASSLLTSRRSTFANNLSAVHGGAIYNQGELRIEVSTFSRNRSFNLGPAIEVADTGSLNMVSATLYDNTAFEDFTTGQLDWGPSTTVVIHNSLFVNGSFPWPACSPGNAATVTFTAWEQGNCGSGVGNRPLAFTEVRPLSRSCGGLAPDYTPTHSLKSPFLIVIDNGSCRVGDPVLDQRGGSRPVGAACDIGATEYRATCDLTLFEDGFEFGTTSAWSITTP